MNVELSEVTSMPHATLPGIGAALRSARDARGNSFEEAAWRTRIKPEYLRALEEERFDAIGHHAVARGHLHTYARYLGLDADGLSREYRKRFEHSEPSPIERLNEQVKEARKPPKPKWLVAALVSSVVLIAASIAGIVRGPGPKTDASARALPTLPASVIATPSVAEPAAPPASPVTIVVVADRRAWVRATVDGAIAFEGTLAEGARKTFTGTERIDLVVGNAGAVRMTVNGRDVGAPGRAGEVYRASFGPRGEIKPE